jgi:hypothetical protein
MGNFLVFGYIDEIENEEGHNPQPEVIDKVESQNAIHRNRQNGRKDELVEDHLVELSHLGDRISFGVSSSHPFGELHKMLIEHFIEGSCLEHFEVVFI